MTKITQVVCNLCGKDITTPLGRLVPIVRVQTKGPDAYGPIRPRSWDDLVFEVEIKVSCPGFRLACESATLDICYPCLMDFCRYTKIPFHGEVSEIAQSVRGKP